MKRGHWAGKTPELVYLIGNWIITWRLTTVRTAWGVSENLLKHTHHLFGLCHLSGHFSPFNSIIFSIFSCFSLGEPSITLLESHICITDVKTTLAWLHLKAFRHSAWSPRLRVLRVSSNCTNSLAFSPSCLPIVLEPIPALSRYAILSNVGAAGVRLGRNKATVKITDLSILSESKTL